MGTRSAVKRFEELETIETRRLLLRMLEKPGRFMDHLRKYVLGGASCYCVLIMESDSQGPSY